MTEDTGLARKRRKPNSIYYNNNYCKMVEPMHKEGCGYSAALCITDTSLYYPPGRSGPCNRLSAPDESIYITICYANSSLNNFSY
jgi:hypothetical protein